ncbi:oxidoreductase [Rhodococcus sp. 15-649-2-2]|uniref:FAD-binding oxidoreductase n=1 Tax=Rhodococcus sp. 15-649-2-2 TaxID=2023140 RepID=UPI000B9ADB98|nr:FAD-binding oxidoreductase [Rhodococcus sp. 15-649-2-2]OZE85659.1 oxidoreductase [Rhodococcus sp. 15-649-2-2]
MQAWSSTVVQYHRLRNDLAVIRLEGDVVPFTAGQSVSVTVPQNSALTRRYSPALPPSLDGKLEFHVRAVPAGWVSGSIVNETRPGDVWQISDPQGGLRVDDSGRDVVMIAGGTGLAPLRAILLDLTRWEQPPNVTLFVGGKSPRDLYAGDMLWLMASQLRWLTVVPVVDQLNEPWAPDRWNDRIRDEIGSTTAFFEPEHCWEGSMADVVATQGPFLDSQILVCGSPGMEAATVRALVETGTPLESIRR